MTVVTRNDAVVAVNFTGERATMGDSWRDLGGFVARKSRSEYPRSRNLASTDSISAQVGLILV
jgi:hypothetical protein